MSPCACTSVTLDGPGGGDGCVALGFNCFCKVSIYKPHFLKEEKKERKKKIKHNSKCG